MESQEAADIIRAISSSLRTNPGQFQISVSMTGFSAQNTGGVGYLGHGVRSCINTPPALSFPHGTSSQTRTRRRSLSCHFPG